MMCGRFPLKGETLRIECGKKVIGRYQVKTGYLKACPEIVEIFTSAIIEVWNYKFMSP